MNERNTMTTIDDVQKLNKSSENEKNREQNISKTTAQQQLKMRVIKKKVKTAKL